jgi:ribose-phosphate pyrophosphokinase
MNKIIFSLAQNDQLGHALADKLKLEIGVFDTREFPDGETYLRIHSDVKNKVIIIIARLDHPNSKIMPLIFMIETLKELGAKKICLVSPYLPYMRQDKRFNPGEAITSIDFAKLISNYVDSLITIDPHLHRINDISKIYSIRTITLHATRLIAKWIKNNVVSPLIIGPDEESTQWVANVATYAESPYIIAKKDRYGDRSISINIPKINDISKTPVLVDDIISTGVSMAVVVKNLLARKCKSPICIGVHALFNQQENHDLLLAGAQQIITCNTIPHFSNRIDITDILIEEIKKC